VRRVCIRSTGSYLPGDPITNQDIERLVGPLPAGLLEGIHVERRHWMVDPATGEHRENNSELAYKAARQALELAGLASEAVDLLVISTSSPDYLLPPLATFVQERLGLRRCVSIDIRSGCAGAIEALDLARLYLERGQFETALVVGSETISPLLVPVFHRKDPRSIRLRDRIPVYSFGDGAAAIVLQATDDWEGGVLGSGLACVGGDRKAGMQVIGAGTHAPIHEQLKAPRLVDLRVDVVESGRFTPYVIAEALSDLAQRSGVSTSEVDLCIIPEGNAGYLTDELREAGLLTPEWLGLEGKVFDNLLLVGCTGSAAVPLALDHAWKTGRLHPGDLLMLLAIETSKWKYAGMALRWTAAPCPAPAARAAGLPGALVAA
jgi:3-oxoacyl-[acyl-carrier-protein] synthase-3